MLKSWLAILVVCLCWPLQGWAVAVDQPLDDPSQEARAREIHKELRCLVCQNQSIEDSNADLARDLRVLVRERIAAGDSDRQTIDFVVARYGDWVLLRPPFQLNTVLLWAAPLIVLVLGGVTAVFWLRRHRARPAAGPAELSADERERLERLLDDGERS